MIDNSTAYDVGRTRGLAGLPYVDIAPRGDCARGYTRGVLERARRRGTMPHTDHRPTYTLAHNERLRATLRGNGDLAVTVLDPDGIVTMTLDLTLDQALELRNEINYVQRTRHESIPVYADRERPTINLSKPA